MTWIKTRPVKAGWYWYRDRRTLPVCVEVTVDPSEGIIVSGLKYPTDTERGEWMGPLDLSGKDAQRKRPPDVVRCENPSCGKSLELSESLLDPDAETPQDRIHTRYDPKVASFAALCRQCRHFTVSVSNQGQNPLSSTNSPPG